MADSPRHGSAIEAHVTDHCIKFDSASRSSLGPFDPMIAFHSLLHLHFRWTVPKRSATVDARYLSVLRSDSCAGCWKLSCLFCPLWASLYLLSRRCPGHSVDFRRFRSCRHRVRYCSASGCSFLTSFSRSASVRCQSWSIVLWHFFRIMGRSHYNSRRWSRQCNHWIPPEDSHCSFWSCCLRLRKIIAAKLLVCDWLPKFGRQRYLAAPFATCSRLTECYSNFAYLVYLLFHSHPVVISLKRAAIYASTAASFPIATGVDFICASS